MNRKQLLILAIVAAVLGGLALNTLRQKSASYQKGAIADAQKLLGDFPGTNIAMLSLQDSSNAVTIVKSDIWRVKERDGYPAAAQSVVELGRKLLDLKVSQHQQIGESQLGRLGLLMPGQPGTNSGLLIELRDKDGKTIRSVLLGKESTRDGAVTGKGRWAYRPDAKGEAYLISETFGETAAAPVSWIDKEFFRVEKLKSVSVTHTNATNSWKISREKEGAELKLDNAAEGETLDPSKASSIGYALGSPYLNDIASLAAKPEETGLDAPVPVTIETFDGFVYSIKVGKPATEGNMYFQISVDAKIARERTPGADEKPEEKAKLDKDFQDQVKKLDDKLEREKSYSKWTYILSRYSLDPLIQNRSALLVDKKPESSTPEGSPASIPGMPPGLFPMGQ